MRNKYALCLPMLAIVTLFLFFMLVNLHNRSDNMTDYWIGSYTFYEFWPPNQNMRHTVSIYDGGDSLYANIKIDGFHTLKRLKAKVWSNGDEIMFVFVDDYIDEEGDTSIPEMYTEGDTLLSLKKQDDILITKWMRLQPMLTENESPGQYFTKVEE